MKSLIKQRFRIHRLKQPICIISQVCKSNLGVGSTGFSGLSFTKPNQGVDRVGFTERNHGKNLPPNLLRLLVGISYL